MGIDDGSCISNNGRNDNMAVMVMPLMTWVGVVVMATVAATR